jgi:protein involved in polysaccharide export with SLBB domain
MTGLAQVSGYSDTDPRGIARRAQYDLYYVDHCSLLLDVRTMARALLLAGSRTIADARPAEFRIPVGDAVAPDRSRACRRCDNNLWRFPGNSRQRSDAMIGCAWRRMGGVGLFIVGLATAGTAWSQTTPAPAATPANPNGEYVIGVGDELQVSVWAHPELERAVVVSRQGTIIFPPVGEIKAIGLTARQLSDRVADRLSTYLRQGASTVTITVKTYASQAVYVSGAVVTPGRYGGETVPTLMEAINMAGGAASNADLNRVTIIRKTGAPPFQITVDVETAMRQGTTDALPALRPGDMIVVPVAVNLVGGVGNEEGVGVLGEVNRPGLYPVGPNEDLWAALRLAGGPTAAATSARSRC